MTADTFFRRYVTRAAQKNPENLFLAAQTRVEFSTACRPSIKNSNENENENNNNNGIDYSKQVARGVNMRITAPKGIYSILG